MYFIIFWTDFYFYGNILFVNGQATDINKYLQIGEASKVGGIPNEIVDLDLRKYPKTCNYCPNFPLKHERSSHCATCGYCIIRRCHHCRWLGKCVGINNTAWFVSCLIWLIVS